MSYNFKKSDGITDMNIADGLADFDQLSIPLVGRNTRGYGHYIAQSFVHMLENFSSNIEPANPTSGQLWWDTSDAGTTREELKIYYVNQTTGSPSWLSFAYKDESGNFVLSGDLLPDSHLTRDIGSPTKQWKNMYAETFHGTATQARYADIAERYESDATYEPGTVVTIGGSAEITLAEDENNVFGIVSTDPAFLMNANEDTDGEKFLPVAIAGRVPVKISGIISKGDRISLDPLQSGVAMRYNGTGTVLGIALGSNDDESTNLVECVVKFAL